MPDRNADNAVKQDSSRDARAGLLLLIGTGLIWGTIGIAAKYVYDASDLDAVSVTWLRALIASPVCILMAWRALGRDLFRTTPRDLVLMSLLGVLLIVYQFLYLAAINRIGVSAATLISLCGAPVVVAVASAVFLGQKMTGRTIAALCGALLGTAMIVGWRTGGTGDTRDTVIGVALSVCSAIGVATHFIFSGRIANRQHPWRPLAIGFTVGAIVFTPLALSRGISFELSASAWSWLIFLAIGPSAFAYAMLQRGLQNVSASDASIVTLLEPLTAAILATYLFGERLGLVGWFGAGLLLSSIALLSFTAGRAKSRVPALESIPEVAT